MAASSGPQTPADLVRMEGISKSFPGCRRWTIATSTCGSGEVHALCGENGAGKSTLMKILAGIYQPDGGGRILIKGVEVDLPTPRAARDLGISIIHQELSLMRHLTVAQNIFIGREPRKAFFLDEDRINQLTRELLARLHLGPGAGESLDPRTKVGELTVAMQQMVEIARALSLNTEVLIMDEPTAALTDTEINTLFDIIRQLRSQGVGIVHISHRLEELKLIADRVTVMRDGRYVDTVQTDAAPLDRIISMMVGRTIFEAVPEGPAEPNPEVVLEVRNLNRGRAIRNVSFQLHRGEILGFAGLVGAGRTEVARAIFGADPDKARVGRDFAQRQTGRDPQSARCGESRHRLPLGGSQTLRSGARPGRRNQHRVGGAQRVSRRAGVGAAGAHAGYGRQPRARIGDQDAQPAAEGAEPLGRQPAEGRRRQMADRQLQRADL